MRFPSRQQKKNTSLGKMLNMDRFLIFEHCAKQQLGAKAIYIENPDGSAKHILAVIDVKKMIPIKKGVYSAVNLNPSETDSPNDKKYKVLLNIEYSFCLKIMDSLIQKASKVYEKQIKIGRIPRFCCDFKLLERICDEFPLE